MRIANKMTQVILGIVVAGILLGNVFPVGLDALNAADTSSWSTEQANIFGVLGIFLVLVPLVVLARSAMEA
jgi:hypothetical protein